MWDVEVLCLWLKAHLVIPRMVMMMSNLLRSLTRMFLSSRWMQGGFFLLLNHGNIVMVFQHCICFSQVVGILEEW
jgi:hypothetical protein